MLQLNGKGFGYLGSLYTLDLFFNAIYNISKSIDLYFVVKHKWYLSEETIAHKSETIGNNVASSHQTL